MDYSQIPFVENELGADGNPQLIPSPAAWVKDAESFKQWFTTTQGVNQLIEVDIEATPRSALLTAFGGDDIGWCPIDDIGLGNADIVSPLAWKDAEHEAADKMHNHLFTAKIEAEFLYQGGKNELIISESDDDSWVFINGKLAIDNGGLHGFTPARVSLDSKATELGIEPGKKYPIVFFYADRYFGGALYRVSHNVTFTHCAP